MWAFIFGSVMIFAILGFIYLISRFYKLNVQKRLFGGRKLSRIAASAAEVALMSVIIGAVLGTVNAVICLIHLTIFWIFCELVFWIAKKIRKKDLRIYCAGAAAFLITFAYLTVGWVLAHNVWQKDYVIETDKSIGNIRIALIADSHVGTTFDGEGFAGHIREIEKQQPDVLLIAGDFIDDDTPKEDMIAACRALGEIKTEYGVYFAFGNHDKGYYASQRGYSGNDLISELEANGVTVLQDDTVLIDDRFYIIGRQDMSVAAEGRGTRASMAELTGTLDSEKYSIIIDHQPCDYDEQEKSGVDLVLSGHTHGGQMIPIGPIGELISANNKTYGHEKRDETNFIVTSGISDWAMDFKTGCKSEYVIIDIQVK